MLGKGIPWPEWLKSLWEEWNKRSTNCTNHMTYAELKMYNTAHQCTSIHKSSWSSWSILHFTGPPYDHLARVARPMVWQSPGFRYTRLPAQILENEEKCAERFVSNQRINGKLANFLLSSQMSFHTSKDHLKITSARYNHLAEFMRCGANFVGLKFEPFQIINFKLIIWIYIYICLSNHLNYSEIHLVVKSLPWLFRLFKCCQCC